MDRFPNVLLCPFLDDHPKYAFGVEFGMLWERMRNPDVSEIRDYYTTENQEQITLAANRNGWRIVEMSDVPESKSRWIWIHLERAKS